MDRSSKIKHILPLFSKYEVIPNAYTRMLGGKPYIRFVCTKLKQLDEKVTIVTDILEIQDLICDEQIDIVRMDLEQFKQSYSNIISDFPLVLINPNAPMLNAKTIIDAKNEINILKVNHIYAALSSVVNEVQVFSNFDDFMKNFLFIIVDGQNKSKLGTQFVISKEECLLVSDINDWILADRLMKRKKIIFRADGYNELGLGHIYNCITLAYSMFEHEVLIVLNECSKEGIQKVVEAQLPYKVICDNKEMISVIEDFRPDIWVNDCLDTDKEYIDFLKSKVSRVITIEDLGEGARQADAVINALYEKDMLLGNNVYSGWEYVCLREEFQIETRSIFSEKVKCILVMFGGTDPSNYNKVLYRIIKEIASQYSNIEFYFIVGIGYNAEANGVVTIEEKRIYVCPNVKRVTKYMKMADIAITSQGRTIFELAAMGVPSIVLSQNERETTHRFAQMENGFLNLGVFKDFDSHILKNTLDWLINTPNIRKSMYNLMKKYPLRDGLKRVKDIILGY